MVKSGVQYSLWGGSVVNLGTESHRRKYFDDIAAFRLPGCFAMTELKHGAQEASAACRAAHRCLECSEQGDGLHVSLQAATWRACRPRPCWTC